MSIKEKIVNSKVVRSVATSKTFNNALTAVGSAALAVSTFAVSASAEDAAFNITNIDTAPLINNAQPFITAAIPVIVLIGGVKLGIRFLRSSMH